MGCISWVSFASAQSALEIQQPIGTESQHQKKQEKLAEVLSILSPSQVQELQIALSQGVSLKEALDGLDLTSEQRQQLQQVKQEMRQQKQQK
jgi:hypothetical protein